MNYVWFNYKYPVSNVTKSSLTTDLAALGLGNIDVVWVQVGHMVPHPTYTFPL